MALRSESNMFSPLTYRECLMIGLLLGAVVDKIVCLF